MESRSADRVFEIFPIGGDVLVAKPDAVEAAEPRELRDPGISQIGFNRQREFILLKKTENAAGAEG